MENMENKLLSKYHSKEDEENIFKLCRKTKKIINNDIESIKIWLREQPHLPDIRDDQIIKNFLIYSKCNIEITKKNIDWYYNFKSIPEFCKNIHPNLAHMKNVLNAIYYVPMPKLMPNLCRVIIYKIRDFQAAKHVTNKYFFGYILNLFEISLRESLQWKFTFIVDLEGTTTDVTQRFNPFFCKKIFAALNKMHGFPTSAIYIINASPIINTIFFFLKTVLKAKIVKRVQFCEREELLHYVPKECLPKDYGGNLEYLEEIYSEIKKIFEKYESVFDDIEKLCTNENLRPTNLENNNWECTGNFRKLEID